MKAILLAALFALAGTSPVFSESPAPPQPKARPSKTAPAATLGFLETRHHSIEIKAGETGTYTVRSKDGKILAENISDSELQARFPELQRVVRSVAWNSDASAR